MSLRKNKKQNFKINLINLQEKKIITKCCLLKIKNNLNKKSLRKLQLHH